MSGKNQLNGRLPRVILIKGGGDLASGAAHRLYKAGFNLVVTEKEQPTVIRRPVSFAQAALAGKAEVEGVTAVRITSVDEIEPAWEKGLIPLLIDPELNGLPRIEPEVLVEGTMAKKNTGVNCDLASIVIALGPGYGAGKEVHAVVETARGHHLGRVIYNGEATPNTGIPGEIEGYSVERVLRAPKAGTFEPRCSIGELVEKGDTVACIEGEPVLAEIGGVVRGLLYEGLGVKEGMKVGDVDPRGNKELCFTISDKSRAVAGGVLEAVLHLSRGGGVPSC